MNILILTKCNNEYGVVTHVINLVNEISRLGDKVIGVSSELKEFGISKLRINGDRFIVISNRINEHAYFQIEGGG